MQSYTHSQHIQQIEGYDSQQQLEYLYSEEWWALSDYNNNII